MDENKEITENEETLDEEEFVDEEESDDDEIVIYEAKEKDAEGKNGDLQNNANRPDNGMKLPSEPSKKNNIIKDIAEIVESTLITVFVIVLVFTYLLHPVNIVGRSMVPTLNPHIDTGVTNTDKIFMTTVFFDIEYGDILVIDKDKNYLLDEQGKPYVPTNVPAINECIIKRVIAVGGQTIDIRDNKVIVDGKVLDEPYINRQNGEGGISEGDAFRGQFPITIPEGYYFVMGDNRNHSTDSRYESVGLVSRDQVYGKAIVKYAPLSEFDILTDSYKG